MAIKTHKTLYAPGSYDFKKVFLVNQDVDIRWKVLEINIFESIFQPCMTADITLIDAENMVANLPIAEGDLVDIHLGYNTEDKVQADADGQDIKCAMEVIKITNRTKGAQQDVQTYNLRLSSAGWANNMRTSVSKSFKQKKYSDIVQEIFDKYFLITGMEGLKGIYSGFGTDDVKSLVKEDTEGSYSVIMPNWKPIQCFNWLAGRSQAKGAVNFVFYEDKEQYNFKSISSLIGQEPTDTYYVKLENIDKNDDRNYFNIYAYKYHDTGDVLLNIANGTFGSRLINHNMMTKEVDDHTQRGAWSLNYNIHGYPANQDEFGVIGTDKFGYIEEFEKTEHTDSFPLIDPSISQTVSENPGNARILVNSTHRYQYDGEKTNHPEEFMRQRIMQKPQSKYLRLTINTIGNFKRKAGETLNIDLPSPEEKRRGQEDVRLSGKYLVTSVRRIFTPKKHDVVMECMKDSYKE